MGEAEEASCGDGAESKSAPAPRAPVALVQLRPPHGGSPLGLTRFGVIRSPLSVDRTA